MLILFQKLKVDFTYKINLLLATLTEFLKIYDHLNSEAAFDKIPNSIHNTSNSK